MASNRFLLALAIVGVLIGVGFLTKSATPGSAGLIYRFTAPDNSFSISFPSKPASTDNVIIRELTIQRVVWNGTVYARCGHFPVVNKNGVAVDDQTVYDNILQGVVKASNGEISSKDNVTTASGVGLHFIRADDDPDGCEYGRGDDSFRCACLCYDRLGVG